MSIRPSHELFKFEGPARLNWSMGNGVPGSMDGLILTSDSNRVHNNCLIKNSKFFVPQGMSLPLKQNEIWQQLPENSMFMFSRNRFFQFLSLAVPIEVSGPPLPGVHIRWGFP